MKKSQKREIKAKKRADSLLRLSSSQGYGKFLFKNEGRGDIILDKFSLDGKKIISPGGVFQGDSTFFNLIPFGVKILEDIMNKEKEVLLLEQPPVVTEQGQVDYVILNESNPEEKETLLVEPANKKTLTKKKK